MTIWRAYPTLAAWFPGLALAGVALSGFAAIVEGAALTFLLPIFENQMGGQASEALPWLGWLKLSGERLIPVCLIIFIALGAVATGSRFLSEAVLLRLRIRIERRAREQMGHALLRMAWPDFVKQKTGEILKAQLADGAQMAMGTQLFLLGIAAALAVIAYLVVAVMISVKMTAYALLFGALGAVLYRLSSRWVHRHSDQLSAIASSIGVKTQEIITGLKYIRSTGMADEAEQRTKALYQDWSRAFFFSQVYTMGNRLVFEVAALLFISAFLAINLIWNDGSIVTVLVFLAVFYRLSPRLLHMQDVLFQSSLQMSWVENWWAKLAIAERAQMVDTGTGMPAFKRAITLRQVGYSYPGTEVQALHAINIEIRAGETLAIVGGSGGGKTTLLDLLTGLLRPTSGEVLVDGVRLDELDLTAWRRGIGLVVQDTPLFHESVQTNITWGAETIDESFVRDCARMAHALEFIEDLPSSFDTVVGEKGGRLSGGQRQRVVLARALYRKPRLLLLDEPTSALDGESEAVVQLALESLRGKCTMVIVTHRLRTARFADRVIVLDGGNVVEEGQWEELLNRPDSRLRKLVALQAVQ